MKHKFQIGDKVISLGVCNHKQTGVVSKYGDVAGVYLVDFKYSFTVRFSQANLMSEAEYYYYYKDDFQDKIKDRMK